MNYQSIEELVSTPRLNSYRNMFQPTDTEELLGVYQWNKACATALYPLIQTTEVVLRNTIHNAVKVDFGSNWHRRPKYLSHGVVSKPDVVKNFQGNMRSAFNSAQSLIQKQGRTSQPTADLIISQTVFSTWENILDEEFHKSGDGSFIWPRCLGRAFPVWPASSNGRQLGSVATLKHIQDQVKTLRLFRNRIAHNEPVWKHNSTHTEQDIFVFLNKKIDAVEKLINWISPDKKLYLSNFGWFQQARRLCCQETLDYYRGQALAKPNNSWKQVKKNIRKATSSNHDIEINITGISNKVRISPGRI